MQILFSNLSYALAINKKGSCKKAEEDNLYESTNLMNSIFALFIGSTCSIAVTKLAGNCERWGGIEK